jgi:hypothetical protein
MKSPKLCSKCKSALPEKNQWYCRTCKAEALRQWRKRNTKRHQATSRMYYYQLSETGFQELLNSQENRCALCRVLFTLNNVPCVDHNHSCCPEQKTCGKCTRGLLCNGCNTTLGKVESIGIDPIVSYLDSYRPENGVPRGTLAD